MERPAPIAVSSLRRKALKSPIVLSSGANVIAARITQPASRALNPIAPSLSEPTTKSCSSDGAINRVKKFQLRMHQRNAIEGTISELVRGYGLRRARYKGFAKVDLQNQLIASACNIKRWFRKLLGTAFGGQNEDLGLNGSFAQSVLADFFAPTDPWSFPERRFA